ncbi:spore protease YyaC [Paenibacillus sp. J2TS4]|uniref:spore protease YyaC n=1 Tax=Paenibacillus sp. J2TS4 TaxID=2807194 RepID=UPI001B1EBC02|nr:spore protease YyaC [Paenibacillus sp. J2TS4]GIP36016.1 hypothetical protein J2TS4_52260 [Paenibacillus sp. J2TS4]
MKFSFLADKNPSDSPILVPYTDSQSAQMISSKLSLYFQKVPVEQTIVFVCIGTDRSTGDALGPLVGSRLLTYHLTDYPVYGTLEEPVHALNLSETLSSIEQTYNNPFIVGIDACLGQLSSVGSIKVGSGPIKPGAGVNKELPPVGNIHITGIVNVGGFMEYFVLQNTRLHLVTMLAEVIAKSIHLSLNHSQRTASATFPPFSLPNQ